MNKIILSKREIKKKQKFIRFLKENDTLAEFIIEFNKGYFIYERQKLHHNETDFSFDAFIHFEWFTTDDFDMWNKISKLIKYTVGEKAFKNFLKRSDENFYNGQ